MNKSKLIEQYHATENKAENFFVMAVIALVLATVVLTFVEGRQDPLKQLVMAIFIVGSFSGALGLVNAIKALNLKEEIKEMK